MLYSYQCSQGHRTEELREVSERLLPGTCEACGLETHFVISQIARAICYGQDRHGGGTRPDGKPWTGPAQKAKWMKERGYLDLSDTHDSGVLNKMNERAAADMESKRQKRLKEVGVGIAQAAGASSEEIVKYFDNGAPVQETAGPDTPPDTRGMELPA